MDALTQEIVRLYVDERLSIRKAGELVGLSSASVHARLHKAGVQARPRRHPRPECARRDCTRRVKRAGNRFCSRDCMHGPPREPCICENCGKIFTPNGSNHAGRFHQQACWNAWTKGRARRDWKYPERMAPAQW